MQNILGIIADIAIIAGIVLANIIAIKWIIKKAIKETKKEGTKE